MLCRSFLLEKDHAGLHSDALLHVDLAPFDAQQLALFAWALARLGLRGAASAGESAFGRIATKAVPSCVRAGVKGVNVCVFLHQVLC